jgi:hypothetical protein
VFALALGTSLAALAAPALAGADYTGTFQTQSEAIRGKGAGKIQMTVTQKGSSLIWNTSTGYTYVCSLKRSRCEGTWSGKTGSGWFNVDFAGNGDSFTGSWGYGSDYSQSASFSGRR